MDKPQVKRRLVIALVLALLLAAIHFTPLGRYAAENPLFDTFDERGEAYLDDAIGKGLAVFAMARVTNGIISTIQSSEVSLSPAGVGVTVGVGEILDPVNDLIERFSWVLMASIVSLGIQKAMLQFSPFLAVNLLASLAIVAFIAAQIRRRAGLVDLGLLGSRLLLAALIVRFCIPAAAMANQVMYEMFLDEEYRRSTSTLESLESELEKTYQSQEADKEDSSLGSQLRSIFSGDGSIAQMRKTVNTVKDKLADYARDVMNLIVVFLLYAIVIPIGVLWLLYQAFRLVARAMVGRASLPRPQS